MTSVATVESRDFDTLVGPWIEPGYRLAVSMLRDPIEARDVVQEAAFKAWRSLDRLRDVDHVRSWFFSIVANQCRSTMRRPWWSVIRLATPDRSLVSPDEHAIQSIDIDRAMNSLSADDRAILHMYFFLDMPLDEIAQVLNISLGAARTRVYRAAHRLRLELKDEEEEIRQ